MRAIFAVLIFIIIISVNYEVWQNYRNTPQDTVYFGATGFYFDYYQYLSWIRDGKNGQILISSRYIPKIEPPVLAYTFFPLVGFFTSFLNFAPHIIYHLSRNFFLMTWLISLFFLSKNIFSEKKWQSLSFLMILIASGFPQITWDSQGVVLSPFIPFWKTFYTLEKFDIYPHHLFANTFITLLLILILRFVKAPKLNLKKGILIGITANLVMLSNPNALIFMLAVLGFPLLLAVLRRKEEDKRFIYVFILGVLSILPIFFYYWKIFNLGNPWQYYYYGEKVGRYNVDWASFLGSLGPLFFTSILSLIFWRKFSFKETFFLSWLLLPLMLFPFVGRQIPFAMSRLLGVNIYIPTSFLTVFFLKNFKASSLLKKTGKSLMIIFLALSLTAGLLYSVQDVYSYSLKNYYNVFLPKGLVSAVAYIEKNTRFGNTVLAGENISSLIPALTSAHAVLGRYDAYRDYEEVKKTVDGIYLRQLNNNQIRDTLKKWRVKYLLFGLDHISYDEFIKKGKIPFVTKAFVDGDIVVGEVSL